jgi:N-acetylneuraminic acid mutarotase
MLTPRAGLGTAVIDGKIYAIGGTSDNLPVNSNEQYDPFTDTWTTEAAMPTARSGVAVAVYQNKIYVIGGTVGGTSFVGNNEVYDPTTNTWETRASMPTPRADLNAVVVGDKIYLIGGEEYSSVSPNFVQTNINEVYDPVNNTWSTAVSCITPVYGYASATINGKIYIIGGAKSPGNTFVNTNQVYDPQINQWSLDAELPALASYGAAAATEGYMAPSQIDFIGGYFSGSFQRSTQVFYPNNDSWSTGASMPTTRAYLSLAVVNDIVYAIGGYDGTNWLNATEAYAPPGYGTVAPIVQITSPENKTYSSVILAFDVNRGAQWIGYSLDNQANETITGDVELSYLTQGGHKLVIYANDSAGNMGASNTVYFSINTLPQKITFLTPQNTSYGSGDIQLTFVTSEPPAWISYNLDNQGNVTIIGNVTLPALPNGSHSLTVYASDVVGNIGSVTVDFTIVTFPLVPVAATITTIVIVLAAGILLYRRKKSGESPRTTAPKQNT